MPDLARDTFTDEAYRLLSLHAEEVNASSWSGYSNSNQALISPAGRVFRSAYNPITGPDRPEGSDCFLSYSPPSGDYKVSMEVYWLGPYGGTGSPIDTPISTGGDPELPEPMPIFGFESPVGPINEERYINDTGVNNNPSAGSNHRVYLYARIQNSPNQHQCFCFGYETTAERYVFCQNQTDIAADGPLFTGWNYTTPAPAWSVNEVRTFLIEVNGTSAKAFVNGIEIFTTTGFDYPTGKVGFELKGGSSPIKGFHVDNFKVESLSPPAMPTSARRNA
jgi:hypothetical protein